MNSLQDLKKEYKYWEIAKDLVDQCIDIMLNLSQSGHPGGSRSKVHAMIIKNNSLKNMGGWIKNKQVLKYSLSPDFDNRWRTVGSVNQIIKESKLDPLSILNAINMFSDSREKRLNILKEQIPDY